MSAVAIYETEQGKEEKGPLSALQRGVVVPRVNARGIYPAFT